MFQQNPHLHNRPSFWFSHLLNLLLPNLLLPNLRDKLGNSKFRVHLMIFLGNVLPRMIVRMACPVVVKLILDLDVEIIAIQV
jgi:hypothetical protein